MLLRALISNNVIIQNIKIYQIIFILQVIFAILEVGLRQTIDVQEIPNANVSCSSGNFHRAFV